MLTIEERLTALEHDLKEIKLIMKTVAEWMAIQEGVTL